MRRIYNIIALSVTLLLSGVVCAQQIDAVEGVRSTIDNISSMMYQSDKPSAIGELQRSSGESSAAQSIEDWGNAKIKSHTSNSGLVLRAGYDLKFGEGSDDIYDDFYSYKHRFNAILSWDILNSGLVGRREVERRVALESEKLRLESYSAQSAEAIYAQKAVQEQVLEGYLNNVYAAKIELYTSLLSLLESLYTQGQSTKIEITEAELQIELTRSLLCGTTIEVEHLLNIEEYTSKQQQIDQLSIESMVANNASVESSRINEELLSNEAEETVYWREVSVSPYVKAQNYSNTSFASSRLTANIGVSATLPIMSGTKSRRTEIKSQKALVENRSSMMASSLRIDIEEIAAQLNRNLEQLMSMAYMERLCHERIKTAEYAYLHKQLSMQELTKYYIKLLDTHCDIVKQIKERELLKTKLILIAI